MEASLPADSSKMDGPNIPSEMDEYPTGDTKEKSKVDRILHRGLAIGKKMLVAGIVISSAPVVIPPLVVLSALGFAVSIPYGMILASFTFSEKLLNKLLPGTSPPRSLEEDDYASAYKEVEEDCEFGGVLGIEEEQEKKYDEVEKDLNSRTGKSIPSEEPREEAVVEPASTRIEGVVLIVEASEHDHLYPEIVEASVEITDVINAEDFVPTDHGVIGKMEAVTEANSNGRKSQRKGREKEEVDERKLPKSSDDSTKIKSGVVQPVTAGTHAEEDQPNHERDGHIKFLQLLVAESLYVSRRNIWMMCDAGDKIKTSEDVAVHFLPGVTALKVETNSARKGIYTEEGIWQKIDAMRRIVGYKAVRLASCMEELRALYLFTGVKPLASFKDTSDLAEANEKLRFLFSVAGVE